MLLSGGWWTPMQDGGGEARRVSLVADDDHCLIEVVDLRDPMRARRGETPFQHVAVDDDRAQDLAIPLTLDRWPCIGQQSAAAHGFGSLSGLHSRPVSAGFFKEPVDRAHRSVSETSGAG
jgi:hypothetical protein